MVMTGGLKNEEPVLEILFFVKGPTVIKGGCIGCGIYQDLQNDHIITYEKVWQNKENLYNHIRLALYRNLLAAIDMASEPPEICNQPHHSFPSIPFNN